MRIEEISRRFGVDACRSEELKAGHINRTYLIDSEEGRYILQSLNMAVYSDPEAVEHNLSEVIRCFRSAGDVHVPDYLTSDTGLFVRTHSEVWRMYRFIPGGVPAREAPFSAGYTCGAFMRTLSAGEPKLTPAIAGFHDFAHHFTEFTKAAEGFAMDDEQCAMKERLTACYERICAVFAGVPFRPIHGDAKGDNFVLCEDLRKGTAIDLDTSMYSHAAVDYGDLIRSLAGAGDLHAAGEITRGFMQGLRGALSPDETGSLYDGVIYVAAELAVRYFTDYIRGGVFFRSKTPEQCLQRVRELLVQLDAFEALEQEMRCMIRSCAQSGGEI